LVFGNEAKGLDDSFLKEGTSVVIKHTNNIDSLNLPIAVGIAIYEFSKKNIY
jgi:TrmH family RNA methyltransferase